MRDARALLALAREDGPSEADRASMWNRLEGELGLAVPVAAVSTVRVAEAAGHAAEAAPSGGGASAGATSSLALKAGLFGGLVGSVITAAGLLVATGATAVGVEAPPEPLAVRRDAAQRVEAPRVLAPLSPPAAEPGREREAPLPAAPGVDALAREVALIVEARRAHVGGDADRALALARSARTLRGQLEREALTLEVRALRALGRDADADADRAEMELRVLHPSAR